MVEQVAAFTDTYLPTVNGVTYTVRSWRERFRRLGGRMPVVFPASSYDPGPAEHPVGSVPFPFYDGFRLGGPRVPRALSNGDDIEVVHAHTPFALGLAASRFARSHSLPLVATYHTPAAAYAEYLAPHERVANGIRRLATGYERWFYERADLVVAPSSTARRHLRERVGVSTPIRVVSNGVDLERFHPREVTDFRARHGLEEDRPLIGYTGRHGQEKRLEELIDAVARLTETRRSNGLAEPLLVLGGDGPAREALEQRARDHGLEARFLGFLERADLPSLYAVLDVFAHPSPVETQGIVALEAIASGTPVVAAAAGALNETVDAGVTGLHYDPGDTGSFGRALQTALEGRSTLEAGCLDVRPTLGVERSVEQVRRLYASLVESGTLG
ncbi:glycosyltransferase [Natrialbaceae archaeon A-CW2]|uniref:glycosyltransferase n=1 Tax=Natronosalvus amylolyticus TaxID=2961994 RepID=UPI0020CA11B9|nr:glycosyltransferase [Natronosalvus amylolyticus]